jgi:Neprosin
MSQKNANNSTIEKWLDGRRSQLKVAKTSTTPHGHIVNWVPLESQSKDRIATPPGDSKSSGGQEPKTPTKHITLDEPEPGPEGHVPIFLPDLSKISKTTTLQNFLNKGRRRAKSKDVPGEPNPAGYFHATSALFTTTFGCSAWLNVWDPKINIPSSPGDDHSISQFWLQYNQSPQLVQSLEAGLTVDKSLNGDLNNHIFSFYTTNNYGNGNPNNNIGGYNALASGWVQVHRTIFPGIRANGSSEQGGTQLEIGLKYQLFEGNWWLGFSNDGAKPWVWLGYYPASLFNGLAKNGTWLSFGGEVESLLANPCSTTDQMGSGRHASTGWTHAAYQRLLINQSDATGTLQNYNGTPEVDVASSKCSLNMYTDQTFMNSGTGWGSYQYYGGPSS